MDYITNDELNNLINGGRYLNLNDYDDRPHLITNNGEIVNFKLNSNTHLTSETKCKPKYNLDIIRSATVKMIVRIPTYRGHTIQGYRVYSKVKRCVWKRIV